MDFICIFFLFKVRADNEKAADYSALRRGTSVPVYNPRRLLERPIPRISAPPIQSTLQYNPEPTAIASTKAKACRTDRRSTSVPNFNRCIYSRNPIPRISASPSQSNLQENMRQGSQLQANVPAVAAVRDLVTEKVSYIKQEHEVTVSDHTLIQSLMVDENNEDDDEYFLDENGDELAKSEAVPLPMAMNFMNLVKVENDEFSGNIPFADDYDEKVSNNHVLHILKFCFLLLRLPL